MIILVFEFQISRKGSRHILLRFHTIFYFNEVDIRIYLPEEVISLLRVDKSLCLPKLKSITFFLYDFSAKKKIV